MTETVTDANGLTWENGGAETDDHLAWGGHEPDLVKIATSLLPEGGGFLDVGAHVGLYSLNLAHKAKEVYAIEANPLTYEVLLANVKHNVEKWPECTIKALNLAAWDTFEMLNMVDENDKATGGSTRCVTMSGKQEVSKYSKDAHITQGAPLSAVLPDDAKVDLVKIDVEGAEARVLRGLEPTIREQQPTLFIEMHDVVYNKPEVRQEVLRFLESVDYTWDDNLTFSIAYYIVAKPRVRVEMSAWEPEVVKAGEDVVSADAVRAFIEQNKDG